MKFSPPDISELQLEPGGWVNLVLVSLDKQQRNTIIYVMNCLENKNKNIKKENVPVEYFSLTTVVAQILLKELV